MKLPDFFRKKDTRRIPMKACMMGPRAVGKTTILTAIFNDTQESIGATTKLLLQPVGDTSSVLTEQKRKLNAVFKDMKDITDRPAAGMEASNVVNTFDFQFGLKGQNPRIDLEIKDFPGEFVESKPEEVKQFINESSAVFVAIDTPHLMEEEGKYCTVKNRPDAITAFFKQSLSQIKGDKLVLLVPLKCEKYFYEKRMSEVLARVKTVYADLLDTLRTDKDKRIACAVTPILTLGDVEFSHFAQQGGAITLNMNHCPAETVYKFRGTAPKYHPAFCVQPLYYMLSFLAASYQRNKANRSLLDRVVGSLFDLFESDTDLFDEILNMEKYRKTDLDGYEIICGSNLFKYDK